MIVALTPATWPDILAIEPKMAAIEAMARQAEPGDWRAWSSIKREFSRFVGWDAQRQELSSCAAYDVCYSYLLAILEAS